MRCSADARCIGCNAPTDCNGTDTACQSRTCVNEVCGVYYEPAGTHVQDIGQCQIEECDGMGAAVVVNRMISPPRLTVN